jgi:threonyl-tRNA synthetase
VQVRILPVAETHEEYASEVLRSLTANGLRAEVVEANDPLGKRIRNSKMEKVPYVLVVGDDDVAHGTVGVNARESDVERDVPLEDFVNRLNDELLGTQV